jgi:hypothetical protein
MPLIELLRRVALKQMADNCRQAIALKLSFCQFSLLAAKVAMVEIRLCRQEHALQIRMQNLLHFCFLGSRLPTRKLINAKTVLLVQVQPICSRERELTIVTPEGMGLIILLEGLTHES